VPSDQSRPAVRERLHEEVREFFFIFVYLWVCFGAVMIFKAAVLRDVGIDVAPLGVAALKAAILGKFLLLGQHTRLDRHDATAPVWHAIARKVAAFFVLLVVLTLLEYLFEAWHRGHGIPRTIAGFTGVGLAEVLARAVLLLLVLIPYIAFREIDAALGHGRIRKLLTETRRPDVPAVARD
jgi:hypothetical protein